MSVNIHPTAIVSEKAKIGANVEVGPFSIIEEDVE
ncbi:MAG: acyl-[acyl-carrier-protein]--UDP-N-acetylglucosamine O-acyltransferase, partial [Hydrogenothermaceae bacterium]